MDIPKITNEEEALAAVKQHGMNLLYVPENLKTAELCLEAVKWGSGTAIRFVPEGLREEVWRKIKSGE